MEEFKVPVLYTAVSNGLNPNPDVPPTDYVTLQGHAFFYNSTPHDKTDLLHELERMYPPVIHYLMKQPWMWRASAEFVFFPEFNQWQIVTYYAFPTHGEGIIFAMWLAEQDFDNRWSPLRQTHQWLN